MVTDQYVMDVIRVCAEYMEGERPWRPRCARNSLNYGIVVNKSGPGVDAQRKD